MAIINRRTVLTGAAATAATVIGPGCEAPTAPAAEVLPSVEPVAKFVKISAGLTGIASAKLGLGADPTNVKTEYFRRATQTADLARRWAVIERIFDQQAEGKFTNNLAGINEEMLGAAVANHESPDIRFYARSIILLWYLGAWYGPDLLRRDTEAPAQPKFPPEFQVISPTAYREAWVWRVAQTHPMGYSEWLFGYWAKQPDPVAASLQKFVRG